VGIAALAACGGDDSTQGDGGTVIQPPEGGMDATAPRDAAGDATASDASSEASDASSDGSNDATSDDGGADEAAADGGGPGDGAAAESGTDGGTGGADAGPDGAPEAGADGGTEAGTDAAPEAGDDAASDGPSDAPAEADAPTCTGTLCGGSCVDVNTDPKNCGACGHACAAGFACTQAECGDAVAGVAAELDGSCVVLHEGTVWCWGAQGSGQTGVSNPPSTGTPTPAKIAGLSQIVDVQGGVGFYCALDAAGAVWCWGDNTYGQLGMTGGVNCNKKSCSPTPQKIAIPGALAIAQVAVGTSTVCARTAGATGGDVYCWGRDVDGVVTGKVPAKATPPGVPTATKVGVFSGDVVDVSVGLSVTAGDAHGVACAVRSDATAWCWGSDYAGELGTGVGTSTCPTATTLQPCSPTPVQIAAAAGGSFGSVAAVRAGDEFACARRQDGSLWCWGSDSTSQLASTCDATAHPKPAQVTFAAGAALVGSGLGAHATDGSGNVWGWGIAEQGQLGDGSFAGALCPSAFLAVAAPTQAMAVTGVVRLAANFDTAIALAADGSVWTWGRNDHDELGHVAGTAGDQKCSTSWCNAVPAKTSNLP
jgi:alpha-tubulin suppressor-like RCC1 family protein